MTNRIEGGEQSGLKRAVEYWQAGKALEAGRIICGNMSAKQLPAWAASSLRLALERSGIQSGLVEQVIHIADHNRLWHEGHGAFSRARSAVLELEKRKRTEGLTKEQHALYVILLMAELVAKVSYNATFPPDPFDEDSAWWIAVCLRDLMDSVWPEQDFADDAVTTLLAVPPEKSVGP